MAFAKTLGKIFKQAVSANTSMYQATRCMSSSKLFIGGLSYNTDDHSLKEAFTSYGQVVEARVIVDRETGRSRGFGFVTFVSSDEASNAISGMDGKELHGRLIRVDHATDRTRGGGGYVGGGSGWAGRYGGSGGGGYGTGDGATMRSYGSDGNYAGGGGNFGGSSSSSQYGGDGGGALGYGNNEGDEFGSSQDGAGSSAYSDPDDSWSSGRNQADDGLDKRS